jgi:hypothetical protein
MSSGRYINFGYTEKEKTVFYSKSDIHEEFDALVFLQDPRIQV